MDMDRMIALTRALRDRVQSYGDDLRRSEALTRYALIDPLLRELGWDTEDPGIVTPEYSVDIYNGGTARADYALTHAGKPLMLIEANKLGEPLLSSNAVEQGIRYCINTAATYFVVTDGQKWEIYNSRVASTNWAHLKKDIVRWLTGDGRHLPLPIRQGNRNLVAATPTHPDGKPFRRHNSEVNGVHVDAFFSRKETFHNIKLIISHAGQDAAKFKLHLQ